MAEAEDLLRWAWAIDPGHRLVGAMLIGLLQHIGRNQEAEEILGRALARSPRDVGLLIHLAEQQLNRGYDDRAETTLRRAWSMKPGHRGVGLRLAKALVATGCDKEAEAVLRLALSRSPDDAEILGRLAKLRFRNGNATNAEALLHRAWSIDPGHRAVGAVLAELLQDIGRDDEAEEVLHRTLARSPQDIGLLIRLAELLLKRGSITEGEAALQRAWSTDPGHRGVAVRLAKALVAGRRDKEAEALLRLALSRSPDDAELLGRLAELRFEQAGETEAEALLRRAWLAEPGHRGTTVRLAVLLQATNRSDEARTLFLQAISLAPEDPQLLVDFGNFLARDGRNAEALSAFIHATELPNAPVSCWLALSRFASRAVSAQAAIDHLHRALDKCGRRAEIEAALVQRLHDFGLVGEAENRISRAIEHFPGNLDLVRLAVNMDILAGRESIHFKTLRALSRNNPTLTREVMAFRARQLKYQWKMEKSRRVLQRIVRRADARSSDFIALAEINALMGGPVEATAALHAGAVLTPRGRRRNVSQGLTGEIINDLSIDIDALSTLQQAIEKGSTNQYLEAVRKYQDHTGCAIALMVHLRRTKAFIREDIGWGDTDIPQKIFQFWHGIKVPEDVQSLMKSWAHFNEDWNHTVFSATTAQKYLRERDDPRVYRAYCDASSAAGQADILRLALLFDQGGVYADADDRCVGPLDPIIRGRHFVAGQEVLGSIGNNFMAACPRHPVIGLALESAVQASLRGDRDSIWLSSGPGLLTRTLAHYLADDPSRLEQLGGKIFIADLPEARQFFVSGCKVSYKHTTRNWQKSEFQNVHSPRVRSSKPDVDIARRLYGTNEHHTLAEDEYSKTFTLATARSDHPSGLAKL